MKTKQSDKQKAIKAIRTYLSAIGKKQVFYGSILADYVKDRIGNKDMYPDTVLRYLRELRSRGEVRYDVILKSESKYVNL